jgi:hypothetical protein
VIRTLGCPLGPHTGSDLTTYLCYASTSIVIMDESNRWVDFNCLNKSVISLSAVIRVLDSPLGPHPESDLPTDLYYGSTPIAIMDESDRWVDFNCLIKSVISLSMAIGASGSPLRPRSQRDLAIDLCSGSTSIAIKDESNHRINFRWLKEIYNITTKGDQGIGISSRNSSENRSHYRSILWLYPNNPLWRDVSIRL